MQTSNAAADTVLAYALAGYAMLNSHSGELMGLLGFTLLVAKLVQELPKAWDVIRGRKSP